MKNKIIRVSTVASSLYILLRGQLKFMSDYYEVIAASTYSKMLESVGENEGVRIKGIELTRKITLRKDIKALYEMYLFLRKEKPLIVHTHSPKAGTVGMIAAWLARVPIRLHTVAGLPLMETDGFKRKLLSMVEKMTYMFATKVYPNSYGLKDFILEEKLCNPKKIHVIGVGSSNGIDTNYFNPKLFSDSDKTILKEKLFIKEKDFIFVFLGRVVRDKGINELIYAFKNLNRRNSKLLIVGPYENELSPLLPETKYEIDKNENIIHVGYQEDVRPYLAISDVLVFPSYREGFPNAVIQAVAMGLPAIVTNINGCNEIIKEKENGIIIPTKDHEALKNAMHYLLENPEEVKRMGVQTRISILNNFEQQKVWDAILSEYKKLENSL